MPSDSDNSLSRTNVLVRVVGIYRIPGFVLPLNTAYKSTSVLNTLYALELGATPLTKAVCA